MAAAARLHRRSNDEPLDTDIVDLLLNDGSETRARRRLTVTIGVAVALHFAVMLIVLPEAEPVASPPVDRFPTINHWQPVPPPLLQEPRPPRERPLRARQIPIPDPTPEDPEPIREYEEMVPEPVAVSEIDLLGAPPSVESTPEPGTLANPIHVSELRRVHHVRPEYPPAARLAGIQGRVLLEATVSVNGTVQHLTVLSCTNPGVGFEESAISAVQQWVYEPAQLDGRPVTVSIRISVDFSLN